MLKKEWEICTVGDISDPQKGSTVTGPFGSSIGRQFWQEAGIPVIRGNNIGFDGPHFVDDGFIFISEDYYNSKMKRYTCLPDDIIFTAAGTIGQVGIIPNNTKYPLYIVSNKQMRLRVNKKIIDPKFAFYHFRTERIRQLIIANNTGSTIPLINLQVLKCLPFPLPSLVEQQSIASILSALDDKIELNLQINKTLEEMAMTLYKHWFVDFGPFKDGEFVPSELGEIPKGWEVKQIGDVIETLGGGTPKTANNEYWENGEIDWFSPTDLTRADSLYSLGSAKKITKLGLQQSSARLFPKGSLMMSSRATIGAIAINRKESCTNQGFITMIPNEKLSLFQLHGWTVSNMDLIISKANGSTFKEISKSNFRSLFIVVGRGIDEYISSCESIYGQIENNIFENQTLTTLRDTLLPKLISGEVRVKDAAKTLAEVL